MSNPQFPLIPAEDDPSEDDSLGIQFFSEDVDFELWDPDQIAAWLESVIEKEGKQLITLSFIFCSDAYLHRLNVDYLQHDTLTDVITFPYRSGAELEGDVFISVERVRENAALFKTDFQRELCRVMVHGVLHLCGYGDKTPDEEHAMREKENAYLSYAQRD